MRSLLVTATLFVSFFVGGIFSSPISAQVKKAIGVKKPVAKPIAKPQPFVKVPGTRVLLSTDSGSMMIRLYDSTPLHRDNFLAKVSEGFYDSLLFHRVIKNFMIQGGDPNSKNAQPGEMLGMGSAPGNMIPAEFNKSYYHKKGALAAARDNNPERASSNCQFYIVQGKKMSDQDLEMMSMQGKTYSPAQKEVYKTIGGTAFLDQNYTVFGEVEVGINIIDKLASVPTAPGDRPLNDLRMKMKVLSEEEVDAIFKEANKPAVIKKPTVKKTISKTVKRK